MEVSYELALVSTFADPRVVGMENSCLTFCTPSTIAGDRSSVDVAAHEISHSWFGNGIGCASWSHFWLNEGWTTYLERLLMREVHGEGERQLSFIVGRRMLKKDLELQKDIPRFQRLVVQYKQNEDPDDAYNQVPYEKGSNFLLHLERTVGGLDHFIPYMKDYVKTFDGTSITTDQWRSHLFHFFGSQPDSASYIRKLGRVDWDEVSVSNKEALIRSGCMVMDQTSALTCNMTSPCRSR